MYIYKTEPATCSLSILAVSNLEPVLKFGARALSVLYISSINSHPIMSPKPIFSTILIVR